jgi:hypothetical protein
MYIRTHERVLEIQYSFVDSRILTAGNGNVAGLDVEGTIAFLGVDGVIVGGEVTALTATPRIR